MSKDEFIKLLKISITVIAILFVLSLILCPIDSSSSLILKTLYSRISGVGTLVIAFWVAYFTRLWKLSFFQRVLIKKPVISGTWIGYLKSDFKKNEKTLPPLKIIFVIHQTFLSIRINSFTEGYAGLSYSENMDYDRSSRRTRLTYHFSQNAVLPDDIDKRQGAAELFLYSDYLAGYYWTVGKTYGFIKIYKVSTNIINSFEEAVQTFSDSTVILQCYDDMLQKTLAVKL
jgi:hypothetical protein